MRQPSLRAVRRFYFNLYHGRSARWRGMDLQTLQAKCLFYSIPSEIE